MIHNIKIFKGKGKKKQRHFWHLEDSKGKILGCGGEPFCSKWACKRSTTRLLTMLTTNRNGVCEIAEAKNKGWFWRIYARNARLMARGTCYYKTKPQALKALNKFSKAYENTEINK